MADDFTNIGLLFQNAAIRQLKNLFGCGLENHLLQNFFWHTKPAVETRVKNRLNGNQAFILTADEYIIEYRFQIFRYVPGDHERAFRTTP